MSEETDKEIARLKAQVEGKHAAMNEFISRVQDKDHEIKKLIQERKDLLGEVDDLKRALKKARTAEVNAKRREEMGQRFLDLVIPIMKDVHELLESLGAGEKIRGRLRVLFLPSVLSQRALDIAIALRAKAESDEAAKALLAEVGLEEFYEIATELKERT